MITGNTATSSKSRYLRFWSLTLSAVLAFTLLQVAPPTRATETTPLSVNLVTTFDDTDVPAALLVGSWLVGTSDSINYELFLDIQNQCGELEHINPAGISGVQDTVGQPIDWTLNGTYFNFLGSASNLELVLDNLRIVEEIGPSEPQGCATSTITWFIGEDGVDDTLRAQGSAEYYISTTDPEPPDPPTPSEPAGCIDYREVDFANNILLDSDGYPIGCNMVGQELVTPNISDNPETLDKEESWSQKFSDEFYEKGPNNLGFTVRNGWACDDCSVGAEGIIGEGPGTGSTTMSGLPLGFTINFYGVEYDNVFVNSNGSLSFGTPSTCYDTPLDVVLTCSSASGGSVIAPYAVDLDNRDVFDTNYSWDSNRHPEFFYWGKTVIDEKDAFVATWMNSIGYDDDDVEINRTGLWSTFQVIIQDTSSSSTPEHASFGSAKVTINYGSIQDSGNGYGPRGNSDPSDPEYPCSATSKRCIAIGLGSNFKNSDDIWDPQLTSLTDDIGTQFNGLGADQVVSDGLYSLSEGTYRANGVQGRYVYSFGPGITPDVATVSSAPENLEVTGSDASIVLSWEPPLDLGGSAISSYTIQYRVFEANEWVTIDNVATSPHSITGLVNGTQYEAKVSAFNGVGDSDFSQSKFATASEFQITSQETFKLANPDADMSGEAFVSQLLGAGITASDVLINGRPEFDSLNAPSFGGFAGGADSVGIEDGIVISPFNVESFQKDKGLGQNESPPLENIVSGHVFEAIDGLLRNAKTWKLAATGGGPDFEPDFEPPFEPVTADGFDEVCTIPISANCANNTTSLEFDLSPTEGQRFLKFEYAIAGTEPSEWEAYNFPDGFALFVGGLDETDNCALIPDGMMDAATSETLSPDQTIGLPERYLSVGNMRLVGLSNTVDSESSLNAEDVSSVLSCVVDTEGYTDTELISVAMVIANANDNLWSPVVFLKAGSVRFESFGIQNDSPANGTVGLTYPGHAFDTTGGQAPYTFELAQGAALPTGLSLSPGGLITGVPTVSGTFDFGIVATDSLTNVSTQNFTLVIDEGQSEVVCTPLEAQLRVLMLGVESEEDAESNIREAACESNLISLEIFDGQGIGADAVKGSAEAWQDALVGIDVVVLPPLGNDQGLFASGLMSEAAFAVLKNWVSDGGRIVLTEASRYVSELNLMLTNVEEGGSIESAPVVAIESAPVGEGDLGVRRIGNANMSLPETLATYGRDGLDVPSGLSNIHVSNYGATPDWDSPSLASSFLLNQGWIVALSNDFLNSDANWTKVLNQSIHSSLNPFMLVREAGIYWLIDRGELDGYNESGEFPIASSGIVRIGSERSPTTISCVNTPLNPAIITRTSEGTTVRCGSTVVADGSIDTPIQARLTRFFAASSPWVKSSVSIMNDHEENFYQNSVWYGGDLMLGSETMLEVNGQKQNLLEEFNSFYPVVVASAGDQIRNDYESGGGRMVVRINPIAQSVTENLGGLGLEDHSSITRNQLWSYTPFEVEKLGSLTLSWFEGYARYDSGCDRMTSLNAWNRAVAFLEDAESENTVDGFKSNDRLNFPNLSDIDCESFSHQLKQFQVTDMGGSARLSWNQIESANKYEISHRVAGATSWLDLATINPDSNSQRTYLAQGLTPGVSYEFRVRPVQENRNSAGDTARGAWTETASVTVTAPKPAAVVLKSQATPAAPKSVKRKKAINFSMKTSAGVAMVVSSKGACKTSKIITKKKVGKKKVSTQTGWRVTATKKGNCVIAFKAKGNAKWKPLNATRTIQVR